MISAPDVVAFLEPACMAAVVSAAFAVLFSVPVRTLVVTALLGALGLSVRLTLMGMGWSIIESTFVAACGIGLCSMFLAWRFHSPTIVFSLPAVIPMVPGVFAYRAMMGILEFTRIDSLDQELLIDITSNAFTTAFLFLCLSIGVALPNLLLRGRSIRSVFGVSGKPEKPALKQAP